MNYAVETIDANSGRSQFMPSHDWMAIIALALLGATINSLSYSNSRSILLQTALLGGIFVIYRSRPVMMIVAYIFLNILPSRMFGGYMESSPLFYTLNSRICIVFALIFFAYGLIILKRSYKIELVTVIFVLFIFLSYAWAVLPTWYDNDLWWMCTAYVLWPLFIQEDNDLRIVLTSYILATGVFCVNVLPMLMEKTELYRGSVNLDPNYAAFFILVGVTAIAVCFAVYGQHINFILRVLLLATGILGIITMSYFASRTSFIILGILGALYLLYNFRRAKTVVQTLLGITLMGFVLEQYGYFEPVLTRFQTVTTSSAGGRLEIQSALLETLVKSDILTILFGNGYLTAGYFGLGMQAHNTYVSIIFGFGLVGFLLYCAYLIRIYLPLKGNLYQPFLIMFWFLCVYGLALEPYHIPEGFLMFCLLSGIANLEEAPAFDEHSAIEGW